MATSTPKRKRTSPTPGKAATAGKAAKAKSSSAQAVPRATPKSRTATPAKNAAGSSARNPTRRAVTPVKAQAATQTRRTLPAAAAASPTPDLYSSIHALLHTMRIIEQQEEPLCSMHDELKRTGKLSAPQRRRLQTLVDELPSAEYAADLQTLRRALLA